LTAAFSLLNKRASQIGKRRQEVRRISSLNHSLSYHAGGTAAIVKIEFTANLFLMTEQFLVSGH
jgi:hypothetical protein